MSNNHRREAASCKTQSRHVWDSYKFSTRGIPWRTSPCPLAVANSDAAPPPAPASSGRIMLPWVVESGAKCEAFTTTSRDARALFCRGMPVPCVSYMCITSNLQRISTLRCELNPRPRDIICRTCGSYHETRLTGPRRKTGGAALRLIASVVPQC